MILPKKSVLLWVMIFLLVITTSAGAFLFKIPILEKQQIAKLSNAELEETFLDVAVELEAVQTFYSNSGFAPKEYDKYKALIKYRILLIQEMEKREMNIPRIK